MEISSIYAFKAESKCRKRKRYIFSPILLTFAQSLCSLYNSSPGHDTPELCIEVMGLKCKCTESTIVYRDLEMKSCWECIDRYSVCHYGQKSLEYHEHKMAFFPEDPGYIMFCFFSVFAWRYAVVINVVILFPVLLLVNLVRSWNCFSFSLLLIKCRNISKTVIKLIRLCNTLDRVLWEQHETCS